MAAKQKNKKESERVELPVDYAERMALAKLIKLETENKNTQLDNVRKELVLERMKAKLAYIDIVENSIATGLEPIRRIIANLPAILSNRIGLSGDNLITVESIIHEVLEQLSEIEIQIEDSETTDLRLGRKDKLL